MFHRSRNLRIDGGTFTEYNLSSNKRSGMELLLDAASPGAFHNSGERFDPPKCYPNTREAVLAKLMDWIVGKVGWEGYIMWLYGPAGAGKSAIAQTIAEMCHANNILLACFFFSRQDPKRNNVKPLAASLAYQIAVNLPQIRSIIEGVVENDPAIFQRSFQVQFNALILEPLTELSKTGIFLHHPVPYLVIIDGLDECSDVIVQRHILDTISDALSRSRHRVPLMFIFASRAEHDITLAFSTPAFEEVTSCVALDDSYQPEADIRRYFEGSFSEIKKTHLQKKSISSSWPADKDLALLVERASGQFIYAATVVRYISSSRYKPSDSLKIILGLLPTRNDSPFAELDALYRDILSRVTDISETRRLLGGIFLSKYDYDDIKDFEQLMFLHDGDVHRLLVDLSSIITVYECEIQVLHASFEDFLFDQERSKEYHINPMSTFTELSIIGLRHVNQFMESDEDDNVPYICWWFANFQDILFHANPTDELREMVLKAPVLESIYSIATMNRVDDWYCDELVPGFLSGLKTAGFLNTEELCLHYRGVWDTILHKKLANIESDTLIAAIVASASLTVHMDPQFVFLEILDVRFELPPASSSLVLVSIVCHYIGPCWDKEYQQLLLEFLADPLRAGKYILDSTKFATLAKIFLDFLIHSPDCYKTRKLVRHDPFEVLRAVEELIPQAGYYQPLVELLTTTDLVFQRKCHEDHWSRDASADDSDPVTVRALATVRILAKYLVRVCGSLPPGFRISAAGEDGNENVWYYYIADDD